MHENRSITGDILLEAGTNEFEVLVFRLGEQAFGVNVAKVREVVTPRPTMDVPHKRPSVIGLFEIRDVVLTLIDLGKHLEIDGCGDSPEETTSSTASDGDPSTTADDEPALGDVAEDPDGRGSIIITEFNGIRVGFLVTAVDRIHRLSWARVMPIPHISFGQTEDGRTISSTTGAIDIDGDLVLIVDFESVADTILTPEASQVEAVDNPLGVDRASKRVIIAEDSPFMRNQIRRVLKNSGYERAEVYSDGAAAYEAIVADGPTIDAVISDIEMPRMDGLRLTKLIKDHDKLVGVPVVLFSSLISKDNANKGRQVGANVQIPKPDLPHLVELVDRVVSGQLGDEAAVGDLRVAA